MKKLLTTRTIAILTLLLTLGGASWLSRGVTADETDQTVSSVFRVAGMTCGGCELGVKLKVKKLDGVESVEASYEEGRAEVAYDRDRVTPQDIIVAIEELGYTAELVDDEHES